MFDDIVKFLKDVSDIIVALGIIIPVVLYYVSKSKSKETIITKSKETPSMKIQKMMDQFK